MAKSDSMKKEINKFLYFYRFLATEIFMLDKLEMIKKLVDTDP